ncbi:hypothetical protein L1987_06721 [Smallanthus sonchifolius]|uniref:Uncharacterized protein n=1 Tax=Smallanthus sonchifolius TaxID=185202 RepID=A0ACB9JYV8_9ASTR|nr:hypothetical protein L1987_06721 [Smallanthus sonchifolius]
MGNMDLFVKFKRDFGINTHGNESDFTFIHGIGEVKDPVHGRLKTLQCVGYVPKVDNNTLTIEQLYKQGIEVEFNCDKCRLMKICFKKREDLFKYKSETDLENEYLKKHYNGFAKTCQEILGDIGENSNQGEGMDDNINMLDRAKQNHEDAYFKREKWALGTYLDNYKDSLDQTDEEVCPIRDFPPGCGPANHVNSTLARNKEPEEEFDGEKLDDTNDVRRFGRLHSCQE